MAKQEALSKKKKKLRLKRFHISYGKRVVFNFALFLVSIVLGLYFIFCSINITQEETVLFNENGNIDYSVCINENEFYEKRCLEKDNSYVASLIDSVLLDFNYEIGGNQSYLGKDLKYKIVANLVIQNKDTSSKYFEKEYVLKNLTSNSELINNSSYKINEEINIDYDFYNEIANSFKSQYGVDVDSYLDVSLLVYNELDEILNIPESSTLTVIIPLSLKSIQIKTNNINNSYKKNVIISKFSIKKWAYLIFGVVLSAFSIFKLSTVISLLHSLGKKKNTYDKVLYKYLKEYDRLIVETRSLPEFDDYNLLKINSFEELVDVRDNLRLPIMYYNVSDHQKAHFYILHEQNLYVYTLKEVDLMNDEKKKN